MSLQIPLTTLTGTYQNFGIESGVYTSGYLTLGMANADVILYFGQAAGNSAPVLAPALTPGQYVITPGTKNPITGVQARAAGGVVGSPAPTLQGQLFQPAEPSIIPVANANSTTNISSTMQKIGQQLLSSPGGSVSFTGIPQTYSCLLLLGSFRSDQVSDQSVFVQFNGDAGADYNQQSLFGTNTTPTSALLTGQTALQVGVAPEGTVNQWGIIDVLFPQYSLTLYQSYRSCFTVLGGSPYAGMFGGYWNGNTSINSLKIFPSTGSFTSFSQFTLYGM